MGLYSEIGAMHKKLADISREITAKHCQHKAEMEELFNRRLELQAELRGLEEQARLEMEE